MIIRSFKPLNWLRHQSFKLCTFNTCKWPRWAKIKTFLQNSLLKINRLNQLIMKLACPMQHHGKYQSKILMKVLKLKAYIPRCQEVKVFMVHVWFQLRRYVLWFLQKGRPGYLDCIGSKFTLLIIPSPTKLRRDIVTLPSVRPSFSNILWTL